MQFKLRTIGLTLLTVAGVASFIVVQRTQEKATEGKSPYSYFFAEDDPVVDRLLPKDLTAPKLKEAKIESLENYSVQQRSDFQQVVSVLRTFVAKKGKRRQNHFFIAKVSRERMTDIWGKVSIYDYTHAYWVENDAIIILSFPLADYDWLEWKCYIDVRKQVVPKGTHSNLGCCLYEADWVRKIVRNCKAGKTLTLKKATR